MRFMVLVKADKKSEAGVLPDMKELADMGKFNDELVKAGRLGQKTGAGIYSYARGGKGADDPALAKLLEKHGKKEMSAEEIQERMFLPMLTEATRVLEEGIVKTPGVPPSESLAVPKSTPAVAGFAVPAADK